MLPYVIRQGDTLAKLAAAGRFDAKQVWSHAKNRALRDKRPNANVLAPGDVLFVSEPDETLRYISAGSANRYKACIPTLAVGITFRDVHGRAIADRCFEVRGAGPPRRGSTNGEGVTTLELPASVREVEILFDGDERNPIRLMIGDMDPIDETSGVMKRLAHLGYFEPWSRDSASESERLGRGIAAFQRAAGLDPTGEIDDQTRSALEDSHGV